MIGYIFCILLSYTAGFLMAAVLGTTDEEDDGMKKLKAYACTDRTECDRYAVVFAETPGKAKMKVLSGLSQTPAAFPLTFSSTRQTG